MNTTKVILNLALCSNILSCLYAAESHPKEDTVKKLFKNSFVRYSLVGAAATLAASTFMLYYREPKPDAKPRYKLSKLIDIGLLISKPGEYFTNWKDLVRDGWIGQYMKDGHMVWKENDGDGYIKQSRKCPPFGVLGTTATLLAVLGKSQKMMKGLAAVGTAATGIFIARNSDMLHKFTRGSDVKLDKQEQLSLDTKVHLRLAMHDRIENIISDFDLQKQLYPKSKLASGPTSAPTATPRTVVNDAADDTEA